MPRPPLVEHRSAADTVSRITGQVCDAGGGLVTIIVDRWVENYPLVGATVELSVTPPDETQSKVDEDCDPGLFSYRWLL